MGIHSFEKMVFIYNFPRPETGSQGVIINQKGIKTIDALNEKYR